MMDLFLSPGLAQPINSCLCMKCVDVQQFLVTVHDIYWYIIAELSLTGNWFFFKCECMFQWYYRSSWNEYIFSSVVAIIDCSFCDKIIVTSLPSQSVNGLMS
jgi:hypothetical protein